MRQLVFASVSAGLAPGRSGYCTAARSPGLRDRLVRELELAGAHEVGEGEAYTFRLLRLAGDTFAVLTRYDDAGPDYTGRASTIAHHLVFDAAETAVLPPPADLARRFTGWLARWDGPARLLDDTTAPTLAGAPAALPAATWKRLTGDAGKAALFCDDAGRAVPGKIPAGPAPADSLALLAELSLLGDDKGWTTPFSTREREPDAWAVRHLSASIDVATLPDPGRAPRAVYARSGAMAGSVPGMGRTSGAAGAGRVRRAAAAPVARNGNTALWWLGGGLALLVAGGALALVLRGGTPAEAPVTPAETVRTPVKTIPPEVSGAVAAIGREDYFRAAELWFRLKTDDPAAAADHAPAILRPLRYRLYPSTVAKAKRTVDLAPTVLPGTTIAGLRETIATLRRLARELDATTPPADSAALADVETRLALMEKIAAAIPACSVTEGEWTTDDDGADARILSVACGETPALRNFLTLRHTALDVSLARFDGFGVRTTPGIVAAAAAKDLSPGKAVDVKDPAHGRLLTLVFDTSGRLMVTRRLPKNAPPSYREPGESDAVAITLVDPVSKESHTLVILTAKSAPKPFVVTRTALAVRDDAVAPVPWLARTLATRLNGLRRPALLPVGYDGDSRQYPGLEADRSVVGQALAARAEALPPGSTSAREALAAKRTALPAGMLDAGDPWSVVVVPTGSPHPRRLIEFSAP